MKENALRLYFYGRLEAMEIYKYPLDVIYILRLHDGYNGKTFLILLSDIFLYDCGLLVTIL